LADARLGGIGPNEFVRQTVKVVMKLVSVPASCHNFPMAEVKPPNDRATRIYRRLKRFRGMDDHERWQHALFFAMSPEERCRLSLQTARSALSLKRSKKNG
jgi:hypothetical protein